MTRVARPRGAVSRSVAALCVAASLVASTVASSTLSAQRPSAPAGTDTRNTPPAPRNKSWRLTWRDEFSARRLDTTRWAHDTGNGFYLPSESRFVSGWGNDELECYTRDSANAFVQGGLLHLRAIASARPGCAYTSARLKTRHPDGHALFAQRYGRFEFRAKLPLGQGLWSALWMLPLRDTYDTWAASGEIDIMEARGQEPGRVLGTLHYGAPSPANAFTEGHYDFSRGKGIGDWHVYAVEWEPGRIRWLIDDVVYQTQDFWWSASTRESKLDAGSRAPLGRSPRDSSELNAWPAPFDQPFYLVMNLAVGGRFLGNPDSTTVFPAEMLVDYVRVYQRRPTTSTRATDVPPRGTGTLPYNKRP